MKNRRKGVTLMEMTIVIAVIGIISTVVVSFTMMVSQRAAVGSGKMGALNEIEMTKAVVEAWVDKIDPTGKASIRFDTDSQDGDKLVADVSGSENRYYIYIQDGMLVAETTKTEAQTVEALRCPAESIKDISFDVKERYDASDSTKVTDRIIFCTLTYVIPKAGVTVSTEEKELTFCINSHLGAS